MKKTVVRLFYILIPFILTSVSAPLCAQENFQDVDETQLLIGEGNGAAPEGADGEETAAMSDEQITTFTFWDFLRMILILGAVIALIYVIFFFIRKRGSPKLQDNELFSIISTQPINNNRTLHLVQVGNQFFLVGSADQSVSLISEISDQETIDEIRLKLSNQRSDQPKSFRNIFSGFMGQKSVRLDGSVNKNFNTNFLKKQKDRLKGM